MFVVRIQTVVVCDVTHYRLVDRYGTVRYSTVRYGTVRYGTVRYGTVRYGMVWYGTVRYGKVATFRWNLLSPSYAITDAADTRFARQTMQIHVFVLQAPERCSGMKKRVHRPPARQTDRPTDRPRSFSASYAFSSLYMVTVSLFSFLPAYNSFYHRLSDIIASYYHQGIDKR